MFCESEHFCDIFICKTFQVVTGINREILLKTEKYEPNISLKTLSLTM